MAFGLQVFDSSGATVFDSTTAVGGVPVGIYTYTTGGTLSFPEHAGRTMKYLLLSAIDFDSDEGDEGISINNTGSPVVTIATRTNARTFMLAVF